MTERARKIVEILESVARGQLEAGVALREWREFEQERDRVITSAWHELHHFAADADIRDRDPAYAESQKKTLLNLAREIREKYAL